MDPLAELVVMKMVDERPQQDLLDSENLFDFSRYSTYILSRSLRVINKSDSEANFLS